jgi:hypothetical protein
MSRLARYVWTAVGFTILVGTVSIWTAPAMIAQVKAALVQDIDSPARNFVQFTLYYATGNLNSYTVPAGKILVIEDCSSFNDLSGAFGVATSATTIHMIPVFPGGGGYVGGRTMRIYASSGTTVIPQTYGSFGPNAILRCSGHLVTQ